MLPNTQRSLARVSAGAIAVATLTIMPIFLVGALAVQLSADLGVPVSALGIATAVFFGAGMLTSILSGVVTARFGARMTMRLSALLVGLVLVAAGLGVHSMASLLVVLALGGTANALAQPAVNLYLAQNIAPGQQGMAYGIKQSAIPVAGMLAGLAVPVLGLTIGWRWAFILFMLPAAVLVLYTPGSDERIGGASAQADALELPRKTLRMIALGGGLGAGCAISLSVFLVPGAVAVGWSEAQAGLIFACASAMGILARLISGVQADRRGARHLEAIALMLGIGVLGFGALASGNHILYAAGAPIAFAFGWGWPGVLIHSVVQLSPASPASGTALVQIGTSGGSVVGPLIFGFLIEQFSYAIAWSAGGGGLLIAAAVFLGARWLAAREAS